MESKKELYKKAKQAYYAGEPIMSDEEFDNLEQELRESGELEEQVGSEDRDAKYSHPTRMLSLSKFQADKKTGAAPTEEAMKWMMEHAIFSPHFEVTLKYDGNSANCIYEDGKLVRVLSRGDGVKGRDITSKIRHLIPEKISLSEGIVEIRGEVIMKTSVFKSKYMGKFANPRNLVAGILGRDDDAMIEDLSFVAYDMKTADLYYSISDIETCAPEMYKDMKPYSETFDVTTDNFDMLFIRMQELRNFFEFPLDGFVLKVQAQYRKNFKENDHDPSWAKAIKFKPVGVVTTIKGVEWGMGKTGKLTPVAVLEPVDLDGSTVSKASLYNAGYIEKNDISIGTAVRIVKSGDIIPQIIEIFRNAD